MLDPLVVEGRGVDPYIADDVLDVDALMMIAREWRDYGMARGMSRAAFRERAEWRRAAWDLAERLGRQL